MVYPEEFWNKRYSIKEYVYGTSPNNFLKSFLDDIPPSNILLPADGEGRNSVYAAQLGWDVTAFDISGEARQKALLLAEKNQVDINFSTTNVLDFKADNMFDVIGFSYAHFPAEIRKSANEHLINFLKPNGKVVFEAFAKTQLGRSSGGPKNLEMLFSIKEIKNEFSALKFDYLEEVITNLSEGQHHVGEAHVIRFIGHKK